MGIKYFAQRGEFGFALSKGAKIFDIANLQNSSDISSSPLKFPTGFFEDLNKLTPIELGAAVPYVSLSTYGSGKEIIDDIDLINQKQPFDMEAIKSKERYSPRPDVSLSSIDITAVAPGGIIEYENIRISLVIHDPNFLSSRKAAGFFIPGMSFLLQYGWNLKQDNSFSRSSDILSTKSRLIFNLKEYILNIKETGEIELILEGLSASERFGNFYLGDVPAEDFGGWSKEYKLSETLLLGELLDKQKTFRKYLSEAKKNNADQMPVDLDIIKKQADNYKANTELADMTARRIIKSSLTKLNEKTSDVNKIINRKSVSFHDLLKELCDSSFTGIHKLYDYYDEIRIHYGQFNENASVLANSSIAAFPIPYQKLNNILFRDKNAKGIKSLRFNDFLGHLCDNFFHAKEYWTKQLKEFSDEKFIQPKIAMRTVMTKENGRDIFNVYFVDDHAEKPKNIINIAASNKSKVSVKEHQRIIKQGKDIPVLSIGNAGSFLQGISLSHIQDEHVRTALIYQGFKDRISGREAIADSVAKTDTPREPVMLPLEGSATLLGHPEWRPFRAFYLSTGVFMIDGVYFILSRNHRITPDGFTSDISFRYA